jgi:SSS family solute:Na+ symporter
MLGVGWYFSRKTATTEEYLLGGRRMRSWSVGLSLFATLISAISYLAVPGEIIQHGPVLLCAILCYPLVALVVGYGLIPFLVKLRVTSAYEILEENLGLAVRMIGSLIFLLTRLTWMALIVFLSAEKVIVPVMGWPPSCSPWVCLALGLITVIYTSMGGLRAVVFTDVIQTLILLSGALLTIVVITVKMGGITPWWPTGWADHWDQQPVFSLDPTVRATVVGAILFQFCWWICTAGSDQMVIQRYLATRDVRSARRTFFIGLFTDMTGIVMLVIVGFALLGFFLAHPELLAENFNVTTAGDKLFPHFIVSILPIGVSGLIVSALLAASMSSLSSGVNSACTVITVDFMNRFQKVTDTESRQVKKARLITLAVGLAVIALSMFMGKVPGNIIEVTNKTNGLFVAPLFGLFFMALFVPFATSSGAIWGSVYGFFTAFVIAYWDVLTGKPGLSWQWIIPCALVANVVTGPLFSLLSRPGKSRLSVVLFSLLAAGVLVILILTVAMQGVKG